MMNESTWEENFGHFLDNTQEIITRIINIVDKEVTFELNEKKICVRQWCRRPGFNPRSRHKD